MVDYNFIIFGRLDINEDWGFHPPLLIFPKFEFQNVLFDLS